MILQRRILYLKFSLSKTWWINSYLLKFL